MRPATRHLLLAYHQCRVVETRGNVKPRLGQGIDSRAAADIATQEWFVPRAASVRQIFTLHVQSIEGFRSCAENRTVDLMEFHFRGFEGSVGGEPGELFGSLQSPSHKLGHSRADDGTFASH